MRINLTRCVWRTELRCSAALNDKCSKASDAIQYNKKENSILYISELDADTSSEALPGLSCITKQLALPLMS